ALRPPHTFPTRRSSDLLAVESSDGRRELVEEVTIRGIDDELDGIEPEGIDVEGLHPIESVAGEVLAHLLRREVDRAAPGRPETRSEEHTSELQSLRHLV